VFCYLWLQTCSCVPVYISNLWMGVQLLEWNLRGVDDVYWNGKEMVMMSADFGGGVMMG